MPKLIYHDSDGVDKVLLLAAEPILIGRATECQVQTQDAMVSRRHARIFWDGNYWIEDLGSSNGVYVGNDKVQKSPFRPGDTVTCGSLVLRLMPDTSPRATGNMAPMTTGAHAAVHAPPHAPAFASTPPVGSNVFAPPPPAPPPPSRAEVQVGPNAILRGAVAGPHANTGAQSSLAEELRLERQKRTDAERAFEEAARQAALFERKLEQAQADLRRARGGAGPAGEDARSDGHNDARNDPRGDARNDPRNDARNDAELQLLRGRIVELEAQLRRARPTDLPAGPAAADAAIALGDSLAELRASLRAANDEAGLLTAPAASVEVVAEALRGAAEQLEAARANLRTLGKLLGVS
jgi:FHA domain-containing protein